MGLKTTMSSSVAHDHGNSLAENGIARVRQLACSLMHQLQQKLGVMLSTGNAMWTWALRHSAWLISRFSVQRGATPYELAYGRCFEGPLCEFGEPVYGFIHGSHRSKTAAKWKRALFLGRADSQSSYVLFDGQSVILSRSVRRIATTWRSHMAFYIHCKCFSWQFRAGFGARVLPTMKRPIPSAVTFDLPPGKIEDSKFHDPEAEAVIKFAEDEKREEDENLAMGQHDPMNVKAQQVLPQIFDDHMTLEPIARAPGMPLSSNPGGAAASSDEVSIDPGLMVPVTPPRTFEQVDSPRPSATTRPGETVGGGEDDAKRARIEESKKQRINRIKEDYASRLSAVKIAYKEYFTMDDYSTELDVENGYELEDDVWAGEDEVQFKAIPEGVWSDHPIDAAPPQPPEQWVEDLADRTEVQRLVTMGVLVPSSEFTGEVTGKLTTKFVRDWRLKDYTKDNGETVERWMRRSRYVAREFAQEKRLDTFSPATGAHTSNLIPLKYLWLKELAKDLPQTEEYDTVLGCVDVADAFLQVEQDNPVLVHIQGEPYVIKKNLPGQRMGARQWYQHLRKFLSSKLAYEFCDEQPCIARNGESTIIIHVDDIMFVGKKIYWRDVFLKSMAEEFSISHSQLDGVGTSINFLRRKVTDMGGWLMLTPGTSVEKVVKSFEEKFGLARMQKIPCSADIQLEDNSPKLSVRDSSHFRSIDGLFLYVGRERPDLMITIKELASSMSAPTMTSLQRLRKMIGYMKYVGDVGIKLVAPMPGQGKNFDGGKCEWILEGYSDADWSSNKAHRRSTSSGVHFINGSFVYASSRSQKTISLSSCESELHALVSCMCDGLYIAACARFIFGEDIDHVQFTDSSSARQLASRQGCGRVRHLSGKILWVQQMVNDGVVILKQVPTLWNVADIGTKCLAQHRLMVLMNETGLVYVANGESVGEAEHQHQVERSGNQKNLQKLAKTIMRLSIAMGLEPVGVAGQQCDVGNQQTETNSFWIWFAVIFIGVVMFAITISLWRKLKSLTKELESAQHQLADHYSYAAWLCERIDGMAWISPTISMLGETVDANATRLDDFIYNTETALATLDDETDCVRFGLMEFGGFVRNQMLTSAQRSQMYIQERANFEVWNANRNRPDTTDELHGEEAEEEQPTGDEAIDPNSIAGMEALISQMRTDQNAALAAELWNDASQIQAAIIQVLDASGGRNPTGMTMEVITAVRGIFQRLYRLARNSGRTERATAYQRYVDNMYGLMQG